MKLDYLLTPYKRINSKGTEELNVRLKTMKLLQENIGGKISDISLSNIFSDKSPQARETKNKQVGLHQTKKVIAQQRKPSTKQKDSPLTRRK